MGSAKTFRHGQILRLVNSERIGNQEELRRRLHLQRLRVTQATLSRDLQELKLGKTPEGYRPASALVEEISPVPSLARVLGEFLLDIPPAENIVVLKTPPSVGQARVRTLSVEAIAASGAGTAFLATPHEASAEIAPQLLAAGLRVVDLSGAFRFREAEIFQRWYQLPAPHAALLGEAAYGLPEFYAKEIAEARLIANPGCYATSVILAVRPLSDAGWIAAGSSVICDCKFGADGAGKGPRRDLQFSEVGEK